MCIFIGSELDSVINRIFNYASYSYTRSHIGGWWNHLCNHRRQQIIDWKYLCQMGCFNPVMPILGKILSCQDDCWKYHTDTLSSLRLFALSKRLCQGFTAPNWYNDLWLGVSLQKINAKKCNLLHRGKMSPAIIGDSSASTQLHQTLAFIMSEGKLKWEFMTSSNVPQVGVYQ